MSGPATALFGGAISLPISGALILMMRTKIGFNLIFASEGPLWTAAFVALCFGRLPLHGTAAGVVGTLLVPLVVVGWVMTVLGTTDLWRIARGRGSDLP